MSQQYRTIIQPALRYIRTQQQTSGAILGGVSSDPSDFSSCHEQPTSFCSSLILEALRNVTGSQTIRTGLASFLLGQRSDQWSWNYWIREAAEAQAQPYPDDIDDTVCAVVALMHHDPNLITGPALACLVQHLIATEQAPGGPYRTWLVDRDSASVWRDVDLAVNANIGYCLGSNNVSVSGLNAYVATKLPDDTLQSAYYLGEIPCIYFLARWYSGDVQRLRSKIEAYGQRCMELSALHISLLLSSACVLGMSTEADIFADALIQKRTKTHWPAAALYSEPAVNGQPRYAGSAALTTAFAVEALTAYDAVQPQPPNTNIAARLTGPKFRSYLPASDLRDTYNAVYAEIYALDHDRQVTGMADITAKACNANIDPSTLRALNLASTHGWIAYTIYDNIWDDEPDTTLLGVANFALRVTSEQFRSGLPDDVAFQKLVAKTLNTVDAANTWEVVHARAIVTKHGLTINELPDYGDYTLLAARSWGHMLAASGVLSAAGYQVDSPEQHALRKFFEHYLIARQLNDDAHDWETDLKRGHLSSVVCMLIRPNTTITFSTDIENLRTQFWDNTLDTVVQLIQQHCDLARQALQLTPLVHAEQFSHWIDSVAAAADLALDEKQRTMDFISAYSGSSDD